jgi:hypothetical protein
VHNTDKSDMPETELKKYCFSSDDPIFVNEKSFLIRLIQRLKNTGESISEETSEVRYDELFCLLYLIKSNQNIKQTY